MKLLLSLDFSVFSPHPEISYFQNLLLALTAQTFRESSEISDAEMFDD